MLHLLHSYIPGINRQIKVFNGGVQPNPVFSVFHRLQYRNSTPTLKFLDSNTIILVSNYINS